MSCLTEDVNDDLREDLHRFWELDNVSTDRKECVEEESVVNQFEKDIYHDGHGM